MRDIRFWRIFCFFCLLCLFWFSSAAFSPAGLLAAAAQQAAAQQAADSSPPTQSDAGKPPRLTLASASGSPGGVLVMPIYFAPEGVALDRIQLKTTFVSRNLKFTRLTRGSAAEGASVEVSSEAIESKDDKGLEHTTLTITAKMPAPAAGRDIADRDTASRDTGKGIPGGLLGYITLRVSETAGPAIISFRSTVEATLVSDPARPQPARQQEVEIIDDQVEIIAAGSEPLVSCFFFTH